MVSLCNDVCPLVILKSQRRTVQMQKFEEVTNHKTDVKVEKWTVHR